MLAADLVLGHGVEGLQHQLAIGVSAGGGRLRVCLGRLKTCPAGLLAASGSSTGTVWRPLGGGRCCLRTRTRGLIKFFTAGVVGDLDAGQVDG